MTRVCDKQIDALAPDGHSPRSRAVGRVDKGDISFLLEIKEASDRYRDRAGHADKHGPATGADKDHYGCRYEETGPGRACESQKKSHAKRSGNERQQYPVSGNELARSHYQQAESDRKDQLKSLGVRGVMAIESVGTRVPPPRPLRNAEPARTVRRVDHRRN